MATETALEFAPQGPISNRHLQSILPSSVFRRRLLLRRAASLIAASEPLLLDCGDGVRLHSWYAPAPATPAGPSRGVAVLIHGWEGTADSSYLLSAAVRLRQEGWDVVRLHLRDHGPSHHLNRELFHSNRLPEVVGAVARIAALFPDRPLCLGGFSLGGNFALRVAARAPEAGIPLARVMAVCPVLDPASTLDAMEQAWPYERYFMAKWRRSLEIKAGFFPELYDFERLRRFRGLRDMTDYFVRDFSEYPDLQSYLAGYAIVGEALAGLEIPALLVAARDDPVIPAKDLARLAAPATLQVVATRRGGHCGFLPSLAGSSWVDEQMARWFAAVAA
ncbi:alpha/beta fold hydrolase [Wenzhouxiangella sp. XN24]|uniref:alpha/beta fold hydrolase n=1 Tax=Wenzhouxiangella sp. XN24 TaxID=2713569 RepID=UPI0013ED2224|nr:alpha/beta fold hydrolase [Wenzhouxiangella sp. XN24]